MSYVGINIGALTVKVVEVQAVLKNARVKAHWGRPLEVLEHLLAQPEFAAAEYFGVSGQMGHILEFAAIQRALSEVGREHAEGKFDAVVSLGGESFLVYTLTEGRVTNVLSHNKCAVGSGEFFVQLIGRMGHDMDAAIQLSSSGKVVPLASRCTVHCKSDVTHKLNRHEATPADCLTPAGAGPTVWHLANRIPNAASFAKRQCDFHPTSFLPKRQCAKHGSV